MRVYLVFAHKNIEVRIDVLVDIHVHILLADSGGPFTSLRAMVLKRPPPGKVPTVTLSTRLVSIQAIGAAAGNMVAIHNVVAASTTVGLLGREGATLRRTLWPTMYYVLMTGIIALIGAYVMDFTDPLMAF